MRLRTTVLTVVAINLLLTFLSTSAVRSRARNDRTRHEGTSTQLRRLFNGTLDEDILRRFIPTPPSPEDVECHVAVRRVEQIGGVCVRLGVDSMPACQAGGYLDPYTRDCDGHNAQAQPQQQPSGSRRRQRVRPGRK